MSDLFVFHYVKRIHIAAIHFNENVNRGQALNRAGERQFNLVFRKAKSDFVVQEIKEEMTFRMYTSKVQMNQTHSTLCIDAVYNIMGAFLILFSFFHVKLPVYYQALVLDPFPDTTLKVIVYDLELKSLPNIIE
jgi:hypothetical protein